MELLEAVSRARQTGLADVAKEELFKALASSKPTDDRDDTANAREARRQARLRALAPSSGIWDGDPDKPKDGVAYQEEMRAEWS
ncbi:hypothetical protein [Duganella aceris]|uniref:Uncharacterized protein n=1 Tax=Duganella aceris TaxID=2703883 RepID=A0ABX0FFR5_9BURK|nr:hypothetical protein [Duganella aceris]NGZ83369.1 hypothetical protein [Duganella aceris]